MSFTNFVAFVNTELPKRPFIDAVPGTNLATGKFLRSTGNYFEFELVDASEITGGASSTEVVLANNGTGNLVVGDKTVDESIIIYYSMKRNTDKQQGVIEIIHDGTNAGMTHRWHSLNNEDIGVTFTDVNISGDNIRLVYSVTDDTYDVDMVYTVRIHALIT